METIDLGPFKSTFPPRPWAMYFVYTPDGNSYLVKGMSPDVHEYIEKHFPVCLFYYTFWKEGKTRGSWRLQGVKGYVIPRKESRYGLRESPKKNRVIYFDQNGKEVVVAEFRRVPKCWLACYNEIPK